MRRVQRQRTKGWRMPEGAVYVGRPSLWGNPYRVGDPDWCFDPPADLDALGAVEHFRALIQFDKAVPVWMLRGASALVCWCPLGQPCHADVLIEAVEALG